MKTEFPKMQYNRGSGAPLGAPHPVATSGVRRPEKSKISDEIRSGKIHLRWIQVLTPCDTLLWYTVYQVYYGTLRQFCVPPLIIFTV